MKFASPRKSRLFSTYLPFNATYLCTHFVIFFLHSVLKVRFQFIWFWSSHVQQAQLRHRMETADLWTTLSFISSTRSLILPNFGCSEDVRRIRISGFSPFALFLDCNLTLLVAAQEIPFASYSLNALFKCSQGFPALMLLWTSHGTQLHPKHQVEFIYPINC